MTGNKLIDLILTGSNTLIAVALAGVFYYSTLFYQKPLPNDQEEFKKLLESTKKAEKIQGLELEKVILNLEGRSSRLRFLETDIHLIPFKAEQTKYLEQNKDQLLDIIIDTASRFTPEDLNSISGKILLEERMKKRIGESLGVTIIREIYFSKFVIQ